MRFFLFPLLFLRRESGSINKLTIEDSSLLAEKLEERVHYSLLVVCTTDKIAFTDNDGHPISKERVELIRKDCAERASNGCREVKIYANIDPSSFRTVLMSDQFERYRDFLIIPPGTSENLFCFVPSFEPSRPVYYAYRDKKDDVKTCKVRLSIPNFEEAIKQKSEELFEEGQIITSVCKGNTPYDPY